MLYLRQECCFLLFELVFCLTIDEYCHNYTFAEINECSTGTHECSENAECINSVSSYQCSCLSGYEGDGKVCQGTYEKYSKYFNKNKYSKYKSVQFFFKLCNELSTSQRC